MAPRTPDGAEGFARRLWNSVRLNPDVRADQKTDADSVPLTREALERDKKKILYCLGGGGLRALMTDGCIQILEEQGIGPPDAIEASSAGSLVGSIYAAKGPAALSNKKESRRFINVFPLHPTTRSIYDDKKLIHEVRDCLGDATMKDCRMPLHIAVTDSVNHKKILLDRDNYDGPLWQAVMASSAIPVLLPARVLAKSEDGMYRFVDEKEHRPGSNTVLVVDGSVSGDIPLGKMKQRIPNIGMVIGIQVIPGSHLIGEIPGSLRPVAKGAQGIIDGYRHLVRSLTPDVLRELGKIGGAGLVNSGPSSLSSALMTLRLHDFGFFDPKKGEYLITPEPTQLVNPIGNISEEALESLVQSGRKAGLETTEKHPIKERFDGIKRQNQEKEDRFRQLEEARAALSEVQRKKVVGL